VATNSSGVNEMLLVESHLTRRLFGSMVQRIAVLSLPAG
jgi:hypothetical protein